MLLLNHNAVVTFCNSLCSEVGKEYQNLIITFYLKPVVYLESNDKIFAKRSGFDE